MRQTVDIHSDKDRVGNEEVFEMRYKCPCCGYTSLLLEDDYCGTCGVHLNWVERKDTYGYTIEGIEVTDSGWRKRTTT